MKTTTKKKTRIASATYNKNKDKTIDFSKIDRAKLAEYM